MKVATTPGEGIVLTLYDQSVVKSPFRTHDPLTSCIAEFHEQLRRAAWSLVRGAITEEIARRVAPRSSAEPRKNARRRGPARIPPPREKTVSIAEAAPSNRTALPPEPSSTPSTVPPSNETPSTESVPPSALDPERPEVASQEIIAEPKYRRPWTRDRVVEELAGWLLAMPTMDAASLVRRKQSALVHAARREFGRFDAALNAANLRLSAMYPDGVPKQGTRLQLGARIP